MGLAIHLIGTARVERDGKSLPAPRGNKVWGLLAYLLRRETPVSRSHLASLLFEEAEDPLAALRWNLSQLRSLLGVTGLRGNALELQLPRSTHVDVDVVVGGSWADAIRVPDLGHALLEGMKFANSPSFEVWLATERRRVQASTEAVLREGALARLAAGAASEAVELAGRLVQLNPLEENYQALLVRSLATAGDGVGAARQVAACRDLFERELGVQPGESLAIAMRTSTAAPTAAPATGRAGVLAQLDAGKAAIEAGVLDAGLQCLRRAIREADTFGDPVLRARARIALGGALVHAARGRDEEGATALHEALAVGEAAAPALAAAACRELGYVEFLRGRYERALVWLRRAETLAGEDQAERARIATVHGAVLSDTAHYAMAETTLRDALSLAEGNGDARQTAYVLSMLGRVHLMCGELDAATETLDRSVGIARKGWTAFTPWPQSLRAEVDLVRGDLGAATERLEHAFALGRQLDDPCWEGIAGRGLGRVAMARGESGRAADILVDALTRCVRLPDAYLWGKAYALDVLCALAVEQRMPQARAWVDELLELTARCDMRELTARAHVHSAALGDSASANAARLAAREIDNPTLNELFRVASRGAYRAGGDSGQQ